MQENSCSNLYPIVYEGIIQQENCFSAKGSSVFLKKVVSDWQMASKMWICSGFILTGKSQNNAVFSILLMIIKNSLQF